MSESLREIEAKRIGGPVLAGISIGNGRGLHLILALLTAGCLVPVFIPAFRDLVFNWTHLDEYSYGPLVPLISMAMVIRDARIAAPAIRPAWSGVFLVGMGSALALLAHVSPFVFPADFGLLIVLAGLLACALGWVWIRSVWPGLAYLLFAVPLPGMLFSQLSTGLQLISSEIGVAIIRFLGMAAFRDGNIIDLGMLQLQVVEACSGLRYLFPLASFAFLAAYLFRAPAWQRILLFLSAVPITIAMNSFRIALTGVLADRFGVAAAQGFIHDFEGWIIFCACVGVLLLEMQVLCLLEPKRGPFSKRLDISWPPSSRGMKSLSAKPRLRRGPLLATLGVAVLALLLSQLAVAHPAYAPQRQSFAAFPQRIGPFQGRPVAVEPEQLQALGLSDYLSMAYGGEGLAKGSSSAPPVLLWIAYYDSQRAGDATHSPRFCIPGSGWSINRLDRTSIAVPNGADTRSIPVNRVLISKGNTRQLVYYWFQERGRAEADEYRVKLNILLDGLRQNRTDGALIRLVTPVGNDPDGRAADDQLKGVCRPTISAAAALRPEVTACGLARSRRSRGPVSSPPSSVAQNSRP